MTPEYQQAKRILESIGVGEALQPCDVDPDRALLFDIQCSNHNLVRMCAYHRRYRIEMLEGTRPSFELVSAEVARRREAADKLRELTSENEGLRLRVDRLSDELSKSTDVRLREVEEALDGRPQLFDSLAMRVRHLLTELDHWIERAGMAERAFANLAKTTEFMTNQARLFDAIAKTRSNPRHPEEKP